MLKNNIIELLINNKESIQKSFEIDDNEIYAIREFLNNEHKDFRVIIDEISASNLTDRGKMALCCLIGYVNGIARSQELIKR